MATVIPAHWLQQPFKLNTGTPQMTSAEAFQVAIKYVSDPLLPFPVAMKLEGVPEADSICFDDDEVHRPTRPLKFEVLG